MSEAVSQIAVTFKTKLPPELRVPAASVVIYQAVQEDRAPLLPCLADEKEGS